MWWLVWLGAGAVVVSFSLVIVRGAPYLPTLRPQIDEALDLLALQPGQTVLELGSGDGRVLLAAARRGWQGIGYELNPILVVVSRLRTWRYRRQVRIIWGDYWRADWPPHDGIFTFLLPRFMTKLDKKITQQSGRPVKLVSFAFPMPHKLASQQRNGLFVYEYK